MNTAKIWKTLEKSPKASSALWKNYPKPIHRQNGNRSIVHHMDGGGLPDLSHRWVQGGIIHSIHSPYYYYYISFNNFSLMRDLIA